MPKVYIAAAFRMFSDRNDSSKAYGKIADSSHAKKLETIEDIFLRYGFDICLPHRDEGRWGEEYFEPGPLSALCLRHVETSDLIFAIAEGGRGVHIELGFASALNKKLILMYKEGSEPSTLIWGLTNDFTPWKTKGQEKRLVIESYTSDKDLLEKTEAILKNYFHFKLANKSNQKKHVGIIDIGSHTLKFRVFSYSKGGVANLIYKENKSLAIIDDILNNGNFSKNTITELISVLKRWKEKGKELKCDLPTLTGTAALRKANNTNELLSNIKEHLDLDTKIITPEKELYYLFKGVSSSFDMTEKISVLGLGGGSVQIGIGEKRSLKKKYYLDFGTNLITKNWKWEKPFTSKEYKKIINYVEDNFQRNIGRVTDRIDNIVYTGGETEFMLKCQLPLITCKSSSIHVSQIDVATFENFCYQFAAMHPNEVFEKFKLDPKWAIGAIAANTIALVTAKQFKVKYIIPSNFNISEGILLSQK